MIKINTIDFQELYLKIKRIKIDIFNKKQHILYWSIFGIIDICLIIFFELEYKNYDDEKKAKILQLNFFISYFLKYAHLFCFIILIICFFLMNFLR